MLPTSRNAGTDRQHVLTSQDPETPWHLHCTFMWSSTACGTRAYITVIHYTANISIIAASTSEFTSRSVFSTTDIPAPCRLYKYLVLLFMSVSAISTRRHWRSADLATARTRTVRLPTLTWTATLRSSKLFGCWSISTKQFAVRDQEHITDGWTLHQRPAKDGDVSMQPLCISTAVIFFCYLTEWNMNTVTELNWTEHQRML